MPRAARLSALRPPGLPRWARRFGSLFGLLLGLICATAGAAWAQSDGCSPQIAAHRAGPGWDLRLLAPCSPYQPVTIRYGALTIAEETGVEGQLTVTLPVLPDQRAQVTGGPLDLSIAAPQGLAPSGFLWLAPSAPPAPGVAPPVGFPAPGALLPELALFAPEAGPRTLDLPVTQASCGKPLAFDLWRDGWEAPRPVRLTLPPCGQSPGLLRLPLPAQ